MKQLLLPLLLLSLAACDDGSFTPKPKTAYYDPELKQIVMPHPCPDWSAPAETNYENSVHSDFGCAVNRDAALQLADPRDLLQGHGNNHPDTGITTHVIEQYRAGTIPVPLTPVQSSSSGSSGGSAQ